MTYSHKERTRGFVFQNKQTSTITRGWLFFCRLLVSPQMCSGVSFIFEAFIHGYHQYEPHCLPPWCRNSSSKNEFRHLWKSLSLQSPNVDLCSASSSPYLQPSSFPCRKWTLCILLRKTLGSCSLYPFWSFSQPSCHSTDMSLRVTETNIIIIQCLKI